MAVRINNDLTRVNLASQIYDRVSDQLMSARFQPGERLKIRHLSKMLETSETPVREALLQLVRDGALEMKQGHYIRVRRLSLLEYLEIRDIRLELETLAATRAVPRLDEKAINRLAESHRKLMLAEKTKNYPDALQHNFDFHFGIYRASGMPQLTTLLEKLWIQVGPMLNFLYPFGHPTYAGAHQHTHILDGLRRRDVNAVRNAVAKDLIEGGSNFVSYLAQLEGQPVASEQPVKKVPRAKATKITPKERPAANREAISRKAGA
jgi:DNA-binding GntR family transcriptional regulator